MGIKIARGSVVGYTRNNCRSKMRVIRCVKDNWNRTVAPGVVSRDSPQVFMSDSVYVGGTAVLLRDSGKKWGLKVIKYSLDDILFCEKTFLAGGRAAAGGLCAENIIAPPQAGQYNIVRFYQVLSDFWMSSVYLRRSRLVSRTACSNAMAVLCCNCLSDSVSPFSRRRRILLFMLSMIGCTASLTNWRAAAASSLVSNVPMAYVLRLKVIWARHFWSSFIVHEFVPLS